MPGRDVTFLISRCTLQQTNLFNCRWFFCRGIELGNADGCSIFSVLPHFFFSFQLVTANFQALVFAAKLTIFLISKPPVLLFSAASQTTILLSLTIFLINLLILSVWYSLLIAFCVIFLLYSQSFVHAISSLSLCSPLLRFFFCIQVALHSASPICILHSIRTTVDQYFSRMLIMWS
jgi:hypothetical protein